MPPPPVAAGRASPSSSSVGGVAPSARDARPVTDEQAESARLLIKISGGADAIDPQITRIAGATP